MAPRIIAPNPDGPAQLVNNYLKAIVPEQRVEHAFGTIKARTGAAVPASPPSRVTIIAARTGVACSDKFRLLVGGVRALP